MKKVTDTTQTDPALLLLEAMVRGGAPGMIEAQEARGQREAVNSDQLPTKGLLGEDRAFYEAMGIKIIEDEPGTTSSKDAMFCAVELPKGWKKEATDHAMWNNLVDDKGRVRATFFYKAAFYDREAFIRPCRRFSVERNYEHPDYKNVLEFQVRDGKKAVFSVNKPLPKKPDGRDDYQAMEPLEKEMRAECVQWLIDNGFPNYNDFGAYWA
jgi:hypothetical protein